MKSTSERGEYAMLELYRKAAARLADRRGISELVAAIGLVAIAAAVVIMASPQAKKMVGDLLTKASSSISGLF